MHILGIIPARGGSKRIHLKNIQSVAGKPLIQYTIDSAKKSKITRLVLSTDNKKIANIAKLLGVETPFLRPKQISGDKSNILSTIKHTLDFLYSKESFKPEIIVILQPTSPFRTSKTINNAIKILKKSNASCVLSVAKSKIPITNSYWYDKGYLKPFNLKKTQNKKTTKNLSLFYPTGTIYAFWYDTLTKHNSMYGPRIKPMVIKNEIELDIDNIFDLFVAEMIFLHWKKFEKKLH